MARKPRPKLEAVSTHSHKAGMAGTVRATSGLGFRATSEIFVSSRRPPPGESST